MSNARHFKPTVAPEVAALGDYMTKKGLEPEGAEAHLVSCSVRWFMGDLGITGNGAFAASLRKAFVSQALFILAEHDNMREKFDNLKQDAEAGVSSDENQ